ncbi:MAG: outer membrane beta-barrel protein [Mariniphaga sp.]
MKIRLIALLFLIGPICLAQEIPANKYKSSIDYGSYTHRLNSGKPNSFAINFNHTNYLNAFYGEAVKRGDVSFVAGASLFYRRQFLKQMFIDSEIFCNLLEYPEITFVNYGLEITGGIILIPFTLKLTSVLQPYAAFGYQTSAMRITSSENAKVLETLKDKTTDTSAPLWKAGIMINLTKTLFLNVQYKQSFTTNKDRDFNAWSAGLGFRF